MTHSPRRCLVALALGVGAFGCAAATRGHALDTAPRLRVDLARQYGCPPGTVDDTVRTPVLTWLEVGVGTEPCELLAHYPVLPHIVRLTSRSGLLRERWEYFYADPARRWVIDFEGVTATQLRAVDLTEPRIRR